MIAYIITCAGTTRFIDQYIHKADGTIEFSIGSVRYKISGDKIYRHNGHVYIFDPTVKTRGVSYYDGK